MGKALPITGLAFIVIGIVMIADAFGSPKETSTIEGGLGIIFVLFIGVGLLVASSTQKKDTITHQ